ncbi:MAG: MgtC/SapB family protein [Chitinophagaceae bacterium]
MPESDMLIRLLTACLIGGVIGLEREYLSKSAGFRTQILICMGSCLFTIFSFLLANNTPDRIASNIVTGIGFVGAGVIFKDDNRMTGITTAATIWVTAALGMGVGAGYYWICAWGTGLALITLLLLKKLEDIVEKVNQNRNYKIVCHYKHETLVKFEEMFKEHRLRFKRMKQSRNGENISGTWTVMGAEKRHNEFIKEILKDDTVLEFEF